MSSPDLSTWHLRGKNVDFVDKKFDNRRILVPVRILVRSRLGTFFQKCREVAYFIEFELNVLIWDWLAKTSSGTAQGRVGGAGRFI